MDQVLDPQVQKPLLSKAAQRALAEAQHRRAQHKSVKDATPETGGRSGPDPIRYGDWEVRGLASDF